MCSDPMEHFLEQESDLESQVVTYKSQLSLVEQQLSVTNDDDCENTRSLKELCSDLKQLISLTEESLLELKKQKLLLMLQGSSTESNPPSLLESVSGCSVDTQPGQSEETDDDLHGMKCQAPLRESWGAVNYHNAMVVCKESVDETPTHSEDDFKVRVLFTHPLHPAMKACPFYLEGSCRFTDDSCRFSHGHTVMLSELHPYQEHDFELAHVGGRCLAKHTDDLWYPALISSLGETIEVHFTTLNITAQLELDHVMPQESSNESESSSDSNSEGDDVRVVEGWPLSLGTDQPLGDWEKHTKGVGSKLLNKMGYVVGQGLGKASQGRVTPVEITILPAGKSLDACADIRESKKLGNVDGKKRRKKNKNKTVLKDEQLTQEPTDMFEFLNTKIFKKDKGPSELQLAKDKSGTSSSAKDNGNLNVKLFKVQEDIKLMKKRRHSLKESLLRHKGKDKAMETHVTDKLANTDREMTQLVRQEQNLLRKISSKSEQKKLSEF